MAIKLIREKITHPTKTQEGDLVFDTDLQCYFFNCKRNMGNINGALGLIDQDWARSLERSCRHHNASGQHRK